MKSIGILGGTFNPPHIGHLLIAEHVRVELGLDEIWFIPTNEPPHKLASNINVEDRLTMLRHAVYDNPFFKVNPIEIKRRGKSYTIDTIVELKQKHPNHQYFFIIGADMVEYLPKWYKIDELINCLTFVGVKRPGYHMNSPYPVLEINIPLFDISSTQIRERQAEGKSIKYLVPDTVDHYIKEQELYEQK
ncbi:nicotinate-nucleotide adenylyltransferase [Virgibacillus sp. MSJ-26]|uniref:nicotinate-nucleotide adenylyltransferase n=1 Tax=Virgibacillus sp. MSJ-26 TaxID=2841522 RepID=UPI001C0F7622|nr:nicotinate-nucleotide adenylyltransferase [Virgibacillus sp. MSJ-26]MBU5466461.1 nicotinate-nucleotide adenylyltransferase [Virgibacillus sp. MSJ-26]